MKSYSGGGYDIPIELVEQILVRLPVKSLVRFKSVCKLWNSIISDRRFVNDHLQVSSASSSSNSTLIFGRIGKNGNNRVISLDAIDVETKPSFSYNITYRIAGEEKKHDCISSSQCNGIVCVVDEAAHRVLFYNPAMREHSSYTIPNSDYMLKSHGFGYDSKTNDYKFVRISSFSRARVYRLGTGQWREIEIGVEAFVMSTGVYLKGRYYWINEFRNCDNKLSILYFDMSEERFDAIDVPPSSNFSKWPLFRLAKQDESLVCFVNDNTWCHSLEMWVMMDGGDWTKHRVFVGLDSPLAIWKHDECLMEDSRDSSSCYESYNMCNGCITKLQQPISTKFLASVDVESLVSFKTRTKI